MPPLYYLVAPRIAYLLRCLVAPFAQLLGRPAVLRTFQIAWFLSGLVVVWAAGYYIVVTFGGPWNNLPLSLPLPSLVPWLWR